MDITIDNWKENQEIALTVRELMERLKYAPLDAKVFIDFSFPHVAITDTTITESIWIPSGANKDEPGYHVIRFMLQPEKKYMKMALAFLMREVQ